MTQVVAVVVFVCAVAVYVTWTASRLDRLVARVETAWAALDAQLVRRAATAAELGAYARRRRRNEAAAEAMEDAALAALEAAPEEREARENDLSRAIRAALAEPALTGEKAERLLAELESAAAKVGFARQFYNDAVRDHGTLRKRLLPRLLARGKPGPKPFFEIDDTALPDLPRGSRALT